jgi:hypothetical protein
MPAYVPEVNRQPSKNSSPSRNANNVNGVSSDDFIKSAKARNEDYFQVRSFSRIHYSVLLIRGIEERARE